MEAELIRRTGARSILLAASGGCTALSLARQFPHLEVVAFDIDPVQLEHLRRKAEAAMAGDGYALNVGDAQPQRLNQCGELEGLFRVLRHFLLEFVLTSESLETFFREETTAAARSRLCQTWLQSRHWPLAFDAAFTDASLRAIFGAKALEHGPPGGYARHFQRALERGLRHPDASRNPLLQHVFLGCYYHDDAPLYARTRGPLRLRLLEGELADVPRLGRFDVISLSNVLDWSDDDRARQWARTLREEARTGCTLLLRQFHPAHDLRHFLTPAFEFDEALGFALREQERSFLYEHVAVGTLAATR